MKRVYRNLYSNYNPSDISFDEYCEEVGRIAIDTMYFLDTFMDDIKECYEMGLSPEECFLEICS